MDTLTHQDKTLINLNKSTEMIRNDTSTWFELYETGVRITLLAVVFINPALFYIKDTFFVEST